MLKFLLVEDSSLVVKVIKHLISSEYHMSCDVAMSFQEARALLEQDHDYAVAVVDLNLPDAPNGEVVDFTLQQGIPTIVLTGTFDEQKRTGMLDKSIVDYIIKESRYSYEYVIKLVKRLDKNKAIKVLVADDSKTSRNFIKSLLKTHLFQVLEAEDGVQALAMLAQNPDIKLLLSDYNMPNMNGFDLVKNIRREVDKNALVIIGISTQDSGSLSAKFIKNGANDFLTKPFCHEEFYCRIQHNIENIENLEAISDAANRDYLTNLHNRRYFFSAGEKQIRQSHEEGQSLVLALLDIDHFKSINDTYGHDAGDAVLVEFSSLMRQAFSRFVFARLGGEEFCVLLNGLSDEQVLTLMENFRVMVEEHLMLLDDFSLSMTVSIGIARSQGEPLAKLMTEADQMLYSAKDSGRNTVISQRMMVEG